MAPSRKSCLITGCSSGGIGAALAEAFAEKGYRVFATARDPTKIPQALHDHPNVIVLALDVASALSTTTATHAVESDTGGTLDVLVNNAGHGVNLPLLDTSVTDARRLFDVNFFGPLETVKAFAPMLVSAKGCVVNNSSIGATQAFPFNGMYGASKAALTLMSETLRLEMAPLGVRVITLMTGGVATKFLSNRETVSLPQESYYHAVKHIIEHQSSEVPMAVSQESFASEVLKPVENGISGKVWVGGAAWMARLLLMFLPERIFDWIALRQKPFSKILEGGRTKIE